MNSYNTILVLFALIFGGADVIAQNKKEISISPYSIQSTYEKLKKDYPFIVPVTEELHSGVIAEENIVYRSTNTSELKADMFYPHSDTLENYPGILLIHGGGWVSGSKENQRPMAQRLAQQGYVTMVVSYRLSREALYPAGVIDLKQAILWMRKNAEKYKIDPCKIAILGASAGAQLATLVGVTPDSGRYKEADPGISDAVQAIVNIDGIVSFIHPEAEESEIAGLWLGGLQPENPEIWKEASPLEYVDGSTPPILFINSTQPRFHAGRDDMIKKMHVLGIYYEVHTIVHTPHSFWLMHPWFETTMNYTIEFLDKVLKDKK